MSEERLQEIKDSVDIQREFLLAQNLGTLCVDEEQELIDEIERLNNDIKELLKENSNKEKVIIAQDNIIKEVREELNKIDSATYQGDTDKKTYYKYEQTRIQKLLEILDKLNKEE